MKHTDWRVFEDELLCSTCQKPLPAGDDPVDGECDLSHPGKAIPRNYREFLPGSDRLEPIVLRREPGVGAVVNIPQRYVVHSPTGFEWGYHGSGPADLALNILALFVAPPEAYRLHQFYKEDVIAKIPFEGAVIEPQEVRDWITRFWANHPASH